VIIHDFTCKKIDRVHSTKIFVTMKRVSTSSAKKESRAAFKRDDVIKIIQDLADDVDIFININMSPQYIRSISKPCPSIEWARNKANRTISVSYFQNKCDKYDGYNIVCIDILKDKNSNVFEKKDPESMNMYLTIRSMLSISNQERGHLKVLKRFIKNLNKEENDCLICFDSLFNKYNNSYGCLRCHVWMCGDCLDKLDRPEKDRYNITCPFCKYENAFKMGSIQRFKLTPRKLCFDNQMMESMYKSFTSS
jgi:hypothetical protein